MKDANVWDKAGSNSVRGHRLERLFATPPRAVDTVRTCSIKGCHTVLSRYNLSSTCWQHERPHRYYHRVRERATNSAA